MAVCLAVSFFVVSLGFFSLVSGLRRLIDAATLVLQDDSRRVRVGVWTLYVSETFCNIVLVFATGHNTLAKSRLQG